MSPVLGCPVPPHVSKEEEIGTHVVYVKLNKNHYLGITSII